MDVESNRSQSAYVYILSNDRLNVLYVGSTSDLRKRLYAHRKGLIEGFTRKYNVHRLVYFERHPGIEEARMRERSLKGKTRAKKIALIESSNPGWDRLFPEAPPL